MAGAPVLLRRAYESSFRLAREEGSLRTIALPAISTGVYGSPRRAAAEIAVAAMRAHEAHVDRIVACLLDADSAAVYRELVAAGGAPAPPAA